jgi:hypothetical protein
VTFHKLAPDMTRLLLVLEYHPQGLFERTGNIWRAQGRRARLELKHFRRHVMTNAILHPEEIEGWRGVIQDGEVVQDHEEALAEEEHGGDEAEDRAQADEPADEEYADDREEPEDTGAEDEYEEAEDEEISPNGQTAERPVRAREGARTSGPSRRAAGGPRRASRSARTEERPQRAARRHASTRGEA